MIDIHSHVIFGVDDGAKNIEQSIEIIKDMIANNVTDLICTPHYRLGMFTTSNDVILNNFKLLKEELARLDLKINLYLGKEVYFNKAIYQDLENLSINQKNVILLEFSYDDNPDIEEILYNLKRLNYKVIIAHIERYNYLTIDDIINLKSKNVFFQINASTIAGAHGLKQKRKALKLVKAGVIDFIASDIHYNRNNFIKKSYDIIYKKFGNDTAHQLFVDNAKFLIE